MGACADLHADAVVDGIGHLAGQEAAPDQAVQPVLLTGQGRIGGADGLVGVLRSGLGLIDAGGCGVIALAVAGADDIPGLGLGLRRDAEGVGTHVGDEAHGALAGDIHALVQLLGDGHGAAEGHVQLA